MNNRKILQWVMLISGGITAGNVLALYFFPFFIPLVNLSIIRLTFISFAEKRIDYILVSCLLVLLIIWGAISVRRNRVWIPAICFAIYEVDMLYASHLFFKDWLNGYFNSTAFWSGVVDIVVVALYVLYFSRKISSIKKNHHN